MTSVAAQFEAVEAASRREEYRAARDALTAIEPTNDAERWAAEAYGLLLQSFDEEPDDDFWADARSVQLDRLARDPRGYSPLRERIFIQSRAALAVRRQRDGLHADIDEFAATYGPSARLTVMRVHTYLTFDEVEEARAELERASVPVEDAPHIEMAWAHLLFRVAELDAAESKVRPLAGTIYEIESWDMLAAIAGARGDLDQELAALTGGIEFAPRGEGLPGRLLQRALVLASLGRVPDARADLERAHGLASGRHREAVEQYVRHRLDALDAAGPQTRHARLEAFPSVVQKWNYCGPAVIELCLRYAGVQLTQELIAEAVKRESGTPMYAIAEFLREHGFEVRRVEATPDRIRAAIDAGVPLILENDYSNTQHVSVAIGYDDRLGIVIVADPTTHVPLRQGLELRERTGAIHRMGAVAVLGRVADVSDETRRLLDDAGLVESVAIAKLDEISRPQHDFSPAFAEVTALEAAGIAAQALAEEPDYASAAIVRVGAHVHAAGGEHMSSGLDSSRVLAQMRQRFDDVSEFAQLAAYVDRNEGANTLAVGEAVVATLLDETDAESRAEVARGLLAMGNVSLAYRYANAAFLRAPSEPSTTVLLVVLCVEELVRRAREQGRVVGALAAVFPARDAPLSEPWPVTGVDIESLARWTLRAAQDIAPKDAGVAVAVGDLALLDGDWERAREAYERARDASPTWLSPKLRLAHVCAQDDPETATRTLTDIVDGHALDDAAWSAVLGLAGRVAPLEQLRAIAATALSSSGERSEVAAAVYAAAMRDSGAEIDAANALREWVAQSKGDADLVHDAALVLESNGVTGVAVEMLREFVTEVPEDARAHFLLGRLLRSTPATRDEAIREFEVTRQLAPDVDMVRHELAWLLLETDVARVSSTAPTPDEHNIEDQLLEYQVAIATGAHEKADRHWAQISYVLGSYTLTPVVAGLTLVNAGRTSWAMRLPQAEQPASESLEDVRAWLELQVATAHGERAAAYLAARPQLLDDATVAEYAARTGSDRHPHMTAEGARRVADRADDPEIAAVFRVASLLAAVDNAAVDERAVDETAVDEAAGDYPAALARAAESSETIQLKRARAERAARAAPRRRAVLGAVHDAALHSGDIATARAVAQELARDYPHGHLAAERLAEVELLGGDVHAALAHAQTAVAEEPECSRANAAAAATYAGLGDWDRAAHHARIAAEAPSYANDLPRLSLAALVLAAEAQRADAVTERAAAFAQAFPDYPIQRVVAACLERANR